MGFVTVNTAVFPVDRAPIDRRSRRHAFNSSEAFPGKLPHVTAVGRGSGQHLENYATSDQPNGSCGASAGPRHHQSIKSGYRQNFFGTITDQQCFLVGITGATLKHSNNNP